MSKLEFIKLLTKYCLGLSDDVEVSNWGCYLYWFVVTFALLSAAFRYIYF